ncbi:MAG: hypothetical protein ABI634_18610 [Acidobacteriota bacterium]
MSHSRAIVISVLLLPVFGRSVAYAQQTPDPIAAQIQSFREQERKTVAREGALDLNIDSIVSAPKNQIAVEIGKDGAATGKARFVFAPSGSDSSFDVVLKGPISSAGEGRPLTERGLGNGATVRFGYNLNLFSLTVSPEGRAAGFSDIHTLAAAVNEVSTASIDRQEKLGPLARNMAASGDLRRRAIERAVHVEHSLFLALSIEAGHQTYAFLNNDLTPGDPEAHTDTQRNAGIGYSRMDGDSGNPLFFFSANYSEGDLHTAGSSSQICSPFGAASSLKCQTAVLGKPAAAKTRSVEVDLRSWSYAQRIGFNPRYVIDRVRDKTTGDTQTTRTTEIAISYLMFKKDKDGNDTNALNVGAFTGGIRIGYQQSQQSGPFVAIFFGTVLGSD